MKVQNVAEHSMLHKGKTMKNNCRGDYQSTEGGITLIALIITIIILVILAAVSINAAYNSGIVDYAVNGTQNYIEGAKKEQEYIANAQELMESALRIVDKNYDIYVAFSASTETLSFAPTREQLPEINTANGDKYYGNIKGIEYDDTRYAPWYQENITRIVFLDTIKPISTRLWFYNLTNITTIDLENLDTSECRTMRGMFSSCTGLTEISNISSLNTNKVTSMQGLFFGCRALTSLNLSNWNTENVETMESMFNGCSGLGSEENTGITFGNSFKTNRVTTMESMFSGCSSLTSLDLSNFNTENVETMYAMFNGCSGLGSEENTGITFGSNFKTNKVKTMRSMFYGCSALDSLDLTGFNTENVETMYAMFWNCSQLTTLRLSNNFKTDKVENMLGVFYNCSSLTSLDISNWNTENVTTMRVMFYGCSGLTSVVDCTGWNVDKVTDHTNFNQNASSNVQPPTWKT